MTPPFDKDICHHFILVFCHHFW